MFVFQITLTELIIHEQEKHKGEVVKPIRFEIAFSFVLPKARVFDLQRKHTYEKQIQPSKKFVDRKTFFQMRFCLANIHKHFLSCKS